MQLIRPYLSFKTTLEVDNKSLDQQLSNVGKLCVDDGREGRVHVCEGGRGCLGLDDRLDQQTPTAHNVFCKKFANNDGYVWRVDLA